MKRVLLLEGLLFLYVGILPAQDQSPARVLDRFLDHVKEAPAMKMDFLWNQTVEGTMVLQGNLFVVHLDEFHVYCNGKEKWYYNEGIDQWEMVPHDKNSADILDNPGAFSCGCVMTSIFHRFLYKKKGRTIHPYGSLL